MQATRELNAVTSSMVRATFSESYAVAAAAAAAGVMHSPASAAAAAAAAAAAYLHPHPYLHKPEAHFMFRSPGEKYISENISIKILLFLQFTMVL